METLMHHHQPVTFELVTPTTPVALVQHYFSLRHQVFTDYWKLQHFSGAEDEYDRIGEILLAMHGGHCIGGVRLVTHKSNSSTLLPMESPDFRLVTLLPELKLQGESYGEIGRAALLAEFRDGSYSKEMYRQIAMRSKALGHKYAFAIAPVVHARKIRIAYKSVGLHTEVRDDIVVPAADSHENIEMRLVMMHVRAWDVAVNYAEKALEV